MRSIFLCTAMLFAAGCGKATPEKPPVAPAPAEEERPRTPAPKSASACSDSEDDVLSYEEISAKKVRYVRFCGVADDKLEELDTLVHVKAGAPLDVDKLGAEVRAQFAAGVFRRFDVVARRTPQADAVDIEMHVQLTPYANSFTIEGATNLPPDDPARQAIELESTAPPAYVRRKADELRDRYRAWGFEDVTIERVLTPVPNQDDLVDITFKVTEGKRTTLGAVSMTGVSREHETELRKHPFLAPGQNLTTAAVEMARELVTVLYRDRGYFKFAGTVERGPRAADFTAPLVIDVTEGPRYRIHDIKYDFEGTAREAAMRRLAKTKIGEYVDQVKARADARNMSDALVKTAPDLEVAVDVIVDSAKPVVDLLFKQTKAKAKTTH